MAHANLNVIGFFRSEIGLGSAARYIAHSLIGANLPANYINIRLDRASNDREFLGKCSPYQPSETNFVITGLDRTGLVYKAIQKIGLSSKNYLYPLWELDRIPYVKLKELTAYDEIIAPSSFIANTFSNFLGRDIKKIHHPVSIPENTQANVIKHDKLKIFTLMDFDSYVARKNPQAVLEAFQLAFPHQFEDVELTIKVRGHNDFGARKILQAHAAKDSRIKVIDKTLSREDMDILLDMCNVYISLHRSEGFGLGPAEALTREKIVICTDYGGTTDFISQMTGYPINYKLIPVKSHEYIYPINQLWAEPSIESAAEALRDIYEHYDEALKRGREGRKLMINQHSFLMVGQALKLIL